MHTLFECHICASENKVVKLKIDGQWEKLRCDSNELAKKLLCVLEQIFTWKSNLKEDATSAHKIFESSRNDFSQAGGKRIPDSNYCCPTTVSMKWSISLENTTVIFYESTRGTNIEHLRCKANTVDSIKTIFNTLFSQAQEQLELIDLYSHQIEHLKNETKKLRDVGEDI